MSDSSPKFNCEADRNTRALIVAEIDPGDGYQTVPGRTLADQHHPLVEVTLPLVITGLDSTNIAALATTLLHAYPGEHIVTLVCTETEARLHVVQLSQLSDLARNDGASALCIPPLPHGSSFNDLLEIVAHLRAPDGCPWDREQTVATIRHDLLGETVEVLEAIDIDETGVDNAEHIAEELGDVLMLATMMTQIAGEADRFQMSDVLTHIVEKLIRRHPHVFGEQSVNGTEEVAVNWDAIKAEEKAGKGLDPAGPLDGVPPQLPALEKARKLQSKARKVGILDRQALAVSESGMTSWLGANPDSERIGAALWALVALADENDINAESALRAFAVNYRRKKKRPRRARGLPPPVGTVSTIGSITRIFGRPQGPRPTSYHRKESQECPPDSRYPNRQSIQYKGHDYSTSGAYFVTVCTRDHSPVLEDEVLRSIVADVWFALPTWFPTIALDEFVIMPNHVHFVVWLGAKDNGSGEEHPLRSRSVSSG